MHESVLDWLAATEKQHRWAVSARKSALKRSSAAWSSVTRWRSRSGAVRLYAANTCGWLRKLPSACARLPSRTACALAVVGLHPPRLQMQRLHDVWVYTPAGWQSRTSAMLRCPKP